jgi:hypothetical protein
MHRQAEYKSAVRPSPPWPISLQTGGSPYKMLIEAIPGLNQLALPEARLVERAIFNGLAPSKMAGHPASHGKRR